MLEYKRSFISLFSETAPYVHRYQLFRDFIDCAAAAIHNRYFFDQSLEDDYRSCFQRYHHQDMENFSKLLSYVVLAFKSGFHDFLGEIYMELDLGNRYQGQVFTPYHISKLCSLLVHGKTFPTLSSEPFVTYHEPACGSGGMVIAFAETMLEAGFDPKLQLWAQCIDVDSLCAKMAYIQLSILGIPSEVVIGDTISMRYSKVLKTPAHYCNDWDAKLKASAA